VVVGEKPEKSVVGALRAVKRFDPAAGQPAGGGNRGRRLRAAVASRVERAIARLRRGACARTPAVLASPRIAPAVSQTIIVLLAFIAFAEIFARLRLGTVLGFLIGGAAIGPSGLGVIRDLEGVHLIAELGVVFLLFNLGLELKLERLRLFGVRVYGLAVAQLLVTAAVIAAAAALAGVPADGAIVVGGALALSSTAVVLQVLRELGRTLAQLGRVAIAILLVQDVAVGPLLVLIKALGQAGGSLALGMLIAFAKAVGVVLVVGLATRFMIRPLFQFVAGIGADEVFAATALLVVLASSFATDQAGLSLELGAFVAGLMVADTEYRHQVAADIGPIRGLLLGFFFMTVGMGVDVRIAAEHLGAIVAIAAALILLKTLLLAALARAFAFPGLLAVELGIMLAQGSEFAFVLLALAAAAGVVAAPASQIIVVAVALTMAVTPVIASLARAFLDRTEGAASAALGALDVETEAVRNHVVVVGFGQVGMAVTRHLVGLRIPALALDFDPKRVRDSQAHRLPVFFGNAARADVLRAAHVGQARLVIVALPSATGGERVVALIHQIHPSLRILARVPDAGSAERMRAAGANAVVVDGLTTARDLAERAVLLYEPEATVAVPAAGETGLVPPGATTAPAPAPRRRSASGARRPRSPP
jgi:CPA2 family monovalent cation:H+ antiporter-2